MACWGNPPRRSKWEIERSRMGKREGPRKGAFPDEDGSVPAWSRQGSEGLITPQFFQSWKRMLGFLRGPPCCSHHMPPAPLGSTLTAAEQVSSQKAWPWEPLAAKHSEAGYLIHCTGKEGLWGRGENRSCLNSCSLMTIVRNTACSLLSW